MYLLVLGASALVTVIGVSALLAVQVAREAAQGQHAATEARLLAQSAVELALLEIGDDPNWRSTYTHDAWTGWRDLGAGRLRYKLVDDADASLADGTPERLRLIGQGEVNMAVRTVGVVLQPPDAANVLTNPGFDGTAAGWSGYPDNDAATVEFSTDVQHGGAGAAQVKSRDSASTGITQSLVSVVEQGASYDIRLWVRMRDSINTVSLYARTTGSTSGTNTTLVASAAVTSTGWTKLSGTWTANWTGSLSDARFWLVTATDHRDFFVDDAVVGKSDAAMVTPVPGTWAQVVGE